MSTYLATVLQPATDLGVRSSRELMSLAQAGNQIIRGEVDRALDTICQRFKSVELAHGGKGLGPGVAIGTDSRPVHLGCECPRAETCVVSRGRGKCLSRDREHGPVLRPPTPTTCENPPSESKGGAEACEGGRKRKRSKGTCVPTEVKAKSKGKTEGSEGEHTKKKPMKPALCWLTAEIDEWAENTPRQTRQRSDVLPLPIPPIASWGDLEVMRVWRGEVPSCDAEKIELTDNWLRVLVRGLNLHDGKDCDWRVPSQVQRKCLRALRDQCHEFVRQDLNF
eukprot:5649838-Amphidinium_carterae.1